MVVCRCLSSTTGFFNLAVTHGGESFARFPWLQQKHRIFLKDTEQKKQKK